MKATANQNRNTLQVWFDDPKNPDVPLLRNAIVRHLRGRGFRIGLDGAVKRQYPSIAKDYHHGHAGDMQVKVSLGGRHIEVNIYTDTVSSNSNGGQHCYHQLELVPYVLRLRFIATANALMDLLRRHGIEVTAEAKKVTGMAAVKAHRDGWMRSHGADFYSRPIQPYNAKAGDGGRLSNGMPVWRLNRYHWRWEQGLAYYSANSTWLFLSPGGEVTQLGSHELRTLRPAGDLRGRHVPCDVAMKHLIAAKQEAVAAEQFERAATLRDVITLRARAHPAMKVAA